MYIAADLPTYWRAPQPPTGAHLPTYPTIAMVLAGGT